MVTYPNQEVITIHKPQIDGQTERFLCVNAEAVRIAAKNLKPGSLKLWLSLAANSDGYVLALSQREMIQWGMSEGTYREAKKELKSQGYLTLRKENHYDFHVFPEEAKAVTAPQFQWHPPKVEGYSPKN